MRFLGIVIAAALLAVGGSSGGRAETGELRIAIQPGLTYLPFVLLRHDAMIERQVEKAGLPAPKVSWVIVAGGDVMNNAILAGDIEIACTGTPPFFTIWAKTKGNLNVRAIGAYNSLPLTLNTTNPAVKTIKDFTENDRIALPGVKASTQALMLEMESERVFGPGQHGRLDGLTVSRAHPDALAALLSPRSEITAHFAAPPYTEQELKDPRVHTVLTAQQVLGGPFTVGISYTTQKFHDANPKTYRAYLAALNDAIARIQSNPQKAAEDYLEVTKERTTVAELLETMRQPGFNFSTTPQNTVKVAQFMYRIGSIKEQPQDWRDLFFPEIYDTPGS
jgi:NitT/TauT family transport system substrate-binding protein